MLNTICQTMYLQGSLLPDWESAPKPLKGGLNQEKSKASLPLADKEDTTLTQLSLLDLLSQKTNE
ncbi:MAG: hypothetical protein PUP92_07000 [Rhizonema sp. PD38]|nr:hypothetical protein [Rhizonema sp. PD38]